MGIKFVKDPSTVEQSNYGIAIVNVYIIYDLDPWPRNPTNNLKFKICLIGATSEIKNNDNERYVYSGYGITFDISGSRSVGSFWY